MADDIKVLKITILTSGEKMKEYNIKINTGQTKIMRSYEQRDNESGKIGNKSKEGTDKYRYLVSTLTED